MQNCNFYVFELKYPRTWSMQVSWFYQTTYDASWCTSVH